MRQSHGSGAQVALRQGASSGSAPLGNVDRLSAHGVVGCRLDVGCRWTRSCFRFWSGHDQGLVAKTSKIERYAKNVHGCFPAQNLMQRVRAKIQQGGSRCGFASIE